MTLLTGVSPARAPGRFGGFLGAAPISEAAPAMRRLKPDSTHRVSFPGRYAPGTIYISTGERRLYLSSARRGAALRHRRRPRRLRLVPGHHHITAKKEWPGWTPPAQMRRDGRPAAYLPGGIENPLARAPCIWAHAYRIHGSNEPETIGQAVRPACIRMTNEERHRPL